MVIFPLDFHFKIAKKKYLCIPSCHHLIIQCFFFNYNYKFCWFNVCIKIYSTPTFTFRVICPLNLLLTIRFLKYIHATSLELKVISAVHTHVPLGRDIFIQKPKTSFWITFGCIWSNVERPLPQIDGQIIMKVQNCVYTDTAIKLNYKNCYF